MSKSIESMSWLFLLQQKVTQSRNSTKWKGLSTLILAVLSNYRSDFPCFNDRFWKSQSNEMKRTFSCHFGFTFTVKETVSVCMIFFESCNSMKMKTTFNCHFGFGFTFFSESHNSIQMKRTFNVILACFQSKSKPLPFYWSILKVAI